MEAASNDDARATRREVRECPICKVDREVVSIEKLPDKKQMTLECGHPLGEIVVVVNENGGISENTSWVILKDPVADVKRAVNENDYFKIVAYACAVLEYCGLRILVWDAKSTGKPLSTTKKRKKGDEWTFYEIINLLRERDKITEEEKDMLHDIRCLRNEFIHEGYSIKISSKTASRVSALTPDIINYTAKLKAVHDELATKGEAASAD
jgi:hypothetical protein